MKRSKRKGPFTIFKDKNRTDTRNSGILKRSFEITSKIIGSTCQVYDGKKFLKLNISENMVGHKLGEFVPTRAKFIYKKKIKKIKMGQKINPNILRLGISKYWKTEFFEKTSKELPRYTFKDLELKNYIERFLDTNGLLLHDYRQNFGNSVITFYVSYFITPSIVTKIKIKKKLTKILIVNKKGEEEWIVKINNLRFNKKPIKLCGLKNPFETFKSEVSISKINKYLINRRYLKLFFIWYNVYKKFKKVRGTIVNFLKTINLFTHNTNNIILNVSCSNTELKRKTTRKHTKQLALKLKRFKNTGFYKDGIELLLNSVINKNSSNLLAKYIAFQIRINKRHKFFLSFFKKVMLILLNSDVAVIKGIKIKIKGRLNGAPKAKRKIIIIGDVPTQSVTSFLDYAQTAVHTKNGTYGIKVWISS